MCSMFALWFFIELWFFVSWPVLVEIRLLFRVSVFLGSDPSSVIANYDMYLVFIQFIGALINHKKILTVEYIGMLT